MRVIMRFESGSPLLSSASISGQSPSRSRASITCPTISFSGEIAHERHGACMAKAAVQGCNQPGKRCTKCLWFLRGYRTISASGPGLPGISDLKRNNHLRVPSLESLLGDDLRALNRVIFNEFLTQILWKWCAARPNVGETARIKPVPELINAHPHLFVLNANPGERQRRIRSRSRPIRVGRE